MKTTVQRLDQYRREAAAGKWARPLTWRDTRRHHSNPWGAPRPNNVRGRRGEIYTDSLEQYGHDLGAAADLFPRLFDHAGWYADNYQDALIVGHVVRIRCPRGTLYVPATMCTDWDGTTHYMAAAELVPRGSGKEDHDAARREAARSADHYAEREAEEAREDSARQQAAAQIEEARAEIHSVNRQALALLAERKLSHTSRIQFSPAVCEAIQARVRGFLAARAHLFAVIRNRQDNYWSACPDY